MWLVHDMKLIAALQVVIVITAFLGKLTGALLTW